MNLTERISWFNPVSGPDPQNEPGSEVDRVLHGPPASPKLDHPISQWNRGDPPDKPSHRGRQHGHLRRRRDQVRILDYFRVSSLGLDESTHTLQPSALGQGLSGPGSALGRGIYPGS